jgi:hypothetical protein
MYREIEHINVLAGDIGFRVATTPGEHRAAQYIEQEMRRDGLSEVRQESFPCSSEAVTGFLPHFYTVLTSSMLAPFVPLLSLFGLIAAPLDMMTELRANKGPITKFTRRGTSHNVIGILPAKSECKTRVILLAHYDTVRVRDYMKPRRDEKQPGRGIVRILLGLSYAASIASTVVGLFGRFKKQKRLVRTSQYVAGAASATLLATMTPILLGQATRGVDGEGANDNASGVAVLLTLAEQLVQTPLEHTEVWFVATGGEEIGLVGALAFADRYGKTLKDAYFLAIDTVGAGRIHYTIQERFTRTSTVPHEMVDILVAASEQGKHGAMPHMLRAGGTDAGAMLDKRFKATSISCLEKEWEFPEINWPTDTRTYIEPETPAKVTAFLQDVLRAINQRVS